MGKELIIMCGAPGSGKSTLVQKHFGDKENVKIVSRDAIRFSMVGEDEEYFSKENEVFAEFVHQVREGLTNAEATVVDATHLTPASRNKLLCSIGKDYFKDVTVECIWVRVPLEVATEQNEQRQGTRAYVPKSVLRRMYGQMREPELDEGFDKIFIYAPHQQVKFTIIQKGDFEK